MILSHFLLASAWVLFCALHSVFAAGSFKKAAGRAMGSQYRFYRLYYTIFSLVSLAAVIGYTCLVPSPRFFASRQLSLVSGILISAAGFTIMSVCILKYFMQLSGVKGLIEDKTKNELMIGGIHKIVRHPLYTGTFIFIWGLFVIFPSVSVLIVDTIITAYTLIGLHFEEQKLQKEFGTKYTDYKRHVPMLIPKFGSGGGSI